MVDPDGDLPFLAIVAIGAATGVFGNGLSNVSNGQAFFQGAGKAAMWGAVGAAASFGIGSAAGGIFGQSASLGKAAFQFGAHGLVTVYNLTYKAVVLVKDFYLVGLGLALVQEFMPLAVEPEDRYLVEVLEVELVRKFQEETFLKDLLKASLLVDLTMLCIVVYLVAPGIRQRKSKLSPETIFLWHYAWRNMEGQYWLMKEVLYQRLPAEVIGVIKNAFQTIVRLDIVLSVTLGEVFMKGGKYSLSYQTH